MTFTEVMAAVADLLTDYPIATTLITAFGVVGLAGYLIRKIKGAVR